MLFRSALVVCPASVKSVWRRELTQWRPDLRVQILEGKKCRPDFGLYDVAIVNYDILPSVGEKHIHTTGAYHVLQAREWLGCIIETIVGDEAHQLSSNKSKRSDSFRACAANANRRWALTGTPMVNKPDGLKNVLVSFGLLRDSFGDYNSFFCLMDGKMGKFGTEWGPNPKPEAKNCMQKVMLRRTKDQVLSDLPDYCEEIVSVKLPQSIERMHDNALKTIKLDDLPGEIGRFSELRKLTASAKVKFLLEFIDSKSFEENGEPLVVFSAHSEPLAFAREREGWAVLDGSVPSEKRARIVSQFQEGMLRGLACNIKAGGVGITLTRASKMIFVDVEWSPALNAQARDRIRRIGQKNFCNYYYIVAETALEQRVWDVLNQKQKRNEAIL